MFIFFKFGATAVFKKSIDFRGLFFKLSVDIPEFVGHTYSILLPYKFTSN